MKLTSTLALALALSVAGNPAIAREKTPATPSYKLSGPFRTAIGPAQTALTAKDTATASAKLDAADAVAQTPDDKYIAGSIRLQLASALNDPAMQAKAVNAMLASGSAPAVDAPKLNYYAGNFAFNAGDYPTALRDLTEAQRLGYTDENLYLLLGETDFKLKQVSAGLAFVDQAIAAKTAAGTKAPEAWYARAASVAYNAKLPSETAKWTRAQVAAYPSVDNWRSALVIYRDGGTRDASTILDIYRLMRATKALAGEHDYYEYASVATDKGLPGEAKSVVDEAFALGVAPKGSRNLTELATLASGKVAADRASLAASERAAAASPTGKTALATGDAYLGYGDNAKAIPLYRLALTKGGVDADLVNTHLGIVLARSGQKADARSAFASVKGARADLAAFWMLWLDQTV